MPFRFVALSLIVSVCAAQTPTTPPPPTPIASGTVTVPPATLIALRLVSSIKSKSTKPGDPVRAVVAFPLAVGTQIAIPAGTYVEGVVDKVNRSSRGNPATVQLRFTRLLFANGYSAALVATNTQASNVAPVVFSRSTDLLADARDGAPYLGEGFGGSGQYPPTPPPLPPLPHNGPSPAVLAGIGIGIAGIVVLAAAIGHHRAANADYVLFDTGWQFQMALQEPLTLDAAQVSAAAALPH